MREDCRVFFFNGTGCGSVSRLSISSLRCSATGTGWSVRVLKVDTNTRDDSARRHGRDARCAVASGFVMRSTTPGPDLS